MVGSYEAAFDPVPHREQTELDSTNESALLRLPPVLGQISENAMNPDMVCGLWLEQAMREASRGKELLQFHLSVLQIPTDEPQGLVCVGEVVSQSTRQTVTEGLLMGVSGRLYARATAVYLAQKEQV